MITEISDININIETNIEQDTIKDFNLAQSWRISKKLKLFKEIIYTFGKIFIGYTFKFVKDKLFSKDHKFHWYSIQLFSSVGYDI